MQNETGTSGYKYGSVTTDEESAVDKSFDETNLYYVKDEELTTKEKAAKLVKLLVPLCIAVALITGFAFVLFRNFGSLYPGPADKHSKYPTQYTPSSSKYVDTTTKSATTAPEELYSVSTRPEPKQTEPNSKPSSSSSCPANPKCAALGLFGECCPTEKGVTLECCS